MINPIAELEAENEGLLRTLELLAENRRLRAVVAAHGLPLPPPRSRLEDIALVVSDEYGITLEAIKGPSKKGEISEARQCFMWRADQVMLDGKHRWSRSEIGRYLARDHTAVIYGVGRHEQRLIEEGSQPKRLDRPIESRLVAEGSDPEVFGVEAVKARAMGRVA